MTVRGVIFDKDGTLFDLQATWAPVTAALVADLAGGDEREAARLAAALGFDLVRGRLVRGSIVVAGTPEEIAVAAAAAHRPPADPRVIETRIEAAVARVRPVATVPLLPVLEALRVRGLRLAVVTNDGEAAARAQLTEAGVLTRFDAIIGYDSGHGAKPDPGPLRAAAARLGLDPAATLVVGDASHDFLAARGAGMRGLAVWSDLVDAEAVAAMAEAVLPDIGHLPAWLG